MIRGGTIGILAGIVVGVAIIFFVPPKPDLPPNTEAQSIYNDDLADEAPRIASAGSLARRKGQVLTIAYDGKDVATFKDTHPYTCLFADPCQTWNFWSALSLKPSPSEPAQPYALVMMVPSEAPMPAIVDHDGHLVWIDLNVYPQNGGRYVASGSFQGMHTGAHLTIIDWASAGHKTAWQFDMGCQPLKWLPNNELMVQCGADTDAQTVMSAIVRRKGESWVIVEDGMFVGEDIYKARFGESYRLSPLKHAPRTFVMKPANYKAPRLMHYGEDPKDPQSGYRRLIWP